MVKNNHTFEELETLLLNQNFTLEDQGADTLSLYKSIAATYSQIENSIAVLSDLKDNRSYIYYGALANNLGLDHGSHEQIESIWEEQIYERIHPDDLIQRNIQELHYLNLLKRTPISQRLRYSTYSTIRMRDSKEAYIPILHRTIYLRSLENGSLWLALCLYNHNFTEERDTQGFRGFILDSATGSTIKANSNTNDILSKREIEILQLIEMGLLSKEIATKLKLSINTVNRHRQNIIEKLCVNNSIEALRKARQLSIIT